MFGMIEGCLNLDQSVPAELFRETTSSKRSAWVSRDWPAAGAGTPIRIALAKKRDRDLYSADGREETGDYLGAVLEEVAVQRGDGIKVDDSASHYAGRKFTVLGINDPEGIYQSLELEALPRGEFG